MYRPILHNKANMSRLMLQFINYYFTSCPRAGPSTRYRELELKKARSLFFSSRI